ncbi:protein virilizer [Aricia agestis]|uniref:protein virilizer n=1 Tax=Aricia agestis TaxID=91739 RepID=UPI001C202BE8|nr:protein virilizer [Aricia agestis]
MASEQPDLLFFDTFSHDTSEELNLDLVQFPKSVFVREIRIIPLGARVEGDFPGGVRLGATNPTKFHIDFFVNDLSKPGASTFEALGSLEYCQNGQIHMECSNDAEQPRIPTDGLVLRGFYTTITLAVYGTLTQVVPDTPAIVNQPPPTQRPVSREASSLPANVSQTTEWNQEASNPIPALPYAANVATSNPDAYGPNQYPENYDSQVYRNEYYPNEAPKDPRTYHHIEDAEWEKDRQDIPCERDADRLRLSPRSLELERDRERREGRSRRRSLDRGRSRETSRHRDRSRDLDRLDRLRSRSRSRDRDYVVKGEYRPLSRSRSRSIDRDWDRGSYKKDDYRRHRDSSYDRSRAGSYEPRSPYDKRAPSYERKLGYDKRSPYDARSSSFERRAPSPYDRKRHSPYRVRGSSYGSRSPSRDDPRKRPRTPPGESRRPLSPRDGDAASPINSVRSEEPPEYDRTGKLVPRIDYYHPNYRHKSSIRSPSQEADPAFAEQPHTSLVTVPIVDTAKSVETPGRNPEDESVDAEPFEPILSDEDICDDLDDRTYMDVDYDAKEYCGVDDIIKYYNPLKDEWKKYTYVNIPYLLSNDKNVKDVTSAGFDVLCGASVGLSKIHDITRGAKKREQKFFCNTFLDIDNSSREDWVHQCELLYVPLTNLCKNTDIVLRIFRSDDEEDACDEFVDIYNLLVTFCRIGLNFEFALAQQQPTYKIRHMKCGVRLVEALMAHRHSGQVMRRLLDNGIDIPMQLLEMYSKEYMALSLRLMILKSLNACLSSKVAIDRFMQNSMFPKFDKNDNSRRPMNGYQALIAMMQCNPLGRIKFSLSALIKKLNIYEALAKLHALVINFSKTTSEKESEESELPESDVNFIVDSMEEILYTYRSQCFHLSQPKRFLPASAQFEISKECSNEILLEFFDIHNILETFVYLLSCPSTCNNLAVTSPIHDLIFELVNTPNGLEFLYEKMVASEILFKILIHPDGQQSPEETAYPHDSNLSNYSDLQILGLELAYRLKAMYYLRSICDAQAGKPDDNELIDRLQALYCLSFGCVGRTAVPAVVVMGDNAECLMAVFESDPKTRSRTESPSKQRSPAKGYAIELIVSAVRFAADVPFLKKYGQRLIDVSREHDRFEPSVSSVLQEVIPYLKPVEKSDVLAGEDLAECVEILKAGLEHSADLPGELTTCLRILRHYCISDYDRNSPIVCESPTEEYVELKYKYNVLQLFSLDGVAHIAGILDRLASHFDQPSMHTSLFASVRGLQLAQLLVPSLRLLDEMLVRVVRCRGPRFRDLTAAPILLRTYGIAKSFPLGCIGSRTAERAAEAAVRALLAYAQPVADDAKDGESIRRGLWTSLCSEVIQYTMTAPCTFAAGLLVFSELLPLPLPLQTRVEPTARELADAANERRLWSAHLHALANDLVDMIQVICMSTYRPVAHMLRRVCVQVADLAPNTASVVARAAVGAVVRELGADRKTGEVKETGDVRKTGETGAAKEVEVLGAGTGAGLARALGLLACLLSHAPVKCAVLHVMASGGPKANDLQLALCTVLTKSPSSGEHAAAQECAAHALAALCDGEVTLSPHTEPEAVVGNSLPSREALATLLDATADCLAGEKTAAVASSILRAYFVLTEHEYGFTQFKKFVTRKRAALGKFFRWALEAGEERAECLALYLDLIRILRAEEGEGPGGRRGVLTPGEMADMVEYSNEDAHPALSLEKTLKERNADEEVVSNATFLVTHLQKLPESEEAVAAAGGAAELVPPPPQPLAAQWAGRTLRCGHAPHERLTAGYWLTVPPPPAEDDVALDLVSCDIMELAQALLGGGAGGGAELAAGLRRLAGVPDARQDTVADDKRPAVALARARDDAFRSRPPNTSRPPSLHVDDFTALQHAPRARHYTPQHQTQHQLARGSRRFGNATPVPGHYRHLRGRGAWEMGGGQHFAGHFPPSQQYGMGGVGWGGGRMARGPRHRSFMR